MSKKRLKKEDEGGGKMYLMAGLVSLVAVGYFVYQVPMTVTMFLFFYSDHVY